MGHKSKEIVVQMSPDQFLDMAEKLNPQSDEGKAQVEANLEKLRGVDKFDQIPVLRLTKQYRNKGLSRAERAKLPTARVSGHEGRHRAMVLKERGVRVFPVTIISHDKLNIRWNEVAELPATISTQSRETRAFPVSIEEVPQLIEAGQMLKDGAASTRVSRRELNNDEPPISYTAELEEGPQPPESMDTPPVLVTEVPISEFAVEMQEQRELNNDEPPMGDGPVPLLEPQVAVDSRTGAVVRVVAVQQESVELADGTQIPRDVVANFCGGYPAY